MKIQLLSDLHLEFDIFNLTANDADVIVLAGDIGEGHTGLDWALNTIKNKPVIYVLGNHEYYNHNYTFLVNELKAKAKNTNVSILENDDVIIDDVRFLGCTLWTDFNLNNNAELAKAYAYRAMSDYQAIRYNRDRLLMPEDTAKANRASLTWLLKQLELTVKEKTVVVTHHAPFTKSIAPMYKGNPLNPAFINDLEEILSVYTKPRLWLHGHCHNSFDYYLEDKRVVCNPKGYRRENKTFNANLIIEV